MNNIMLIFEKCFISAYISCEFLYVFNVLILLMVMEKNQMNSIMKFFHGVISIS